MNTTNAIAHYVSGLKYADIPVEATGIVKKALLDFLGVSFSGALMPEKMIVDLVRGLGGPSESIIISGGYLAPANMAALANGMLASAPDSSDTSLTWNVGHPTETIMPALLALGEKHSLSGKDLITAYVAGFEAGSRIGASLEKHYTMGWHSTATVGSLAAAAASCNMMHLDPAKVCNALGIAGSMAFGLKLNLGTGTRSLHAGRAAQSGILAAELTGAGLTANNAIFEGATGYVNLMGGTEHLLELGAGTLGTSYDIVAPGGLSFKLHACCYMAAWCADAIIYIADRSNIRIEDVEHITCSIPKPLSQTLTCHRPQTGADGMYSLEYCMAAAILDHRLGLAQFTTEKVLRPEAQALFENVDIVFPNESLEMGLSEAFRQPSSVTVQLKDGSEISREVKFPRGDIRNQVSEAEIQEKFREYSCALLDHGQQDEIIDAVFNLERLVLISDISRIILKIKVN